MVFRMASADGRMHEGWSDDASEELTALVERITFGETWGQC
jgi:hypothetical protein